MTKLAAEGLKFTHAFVASPACGPSRTALLTGLWPHATVPSQITAKAPDVASLPPVLHALGYEIAAIGKVAHNNSAKPHGFDYVEGPNPGFKNTDAVAKFLANRDAIETAVPFRRHATSAHAWSDNALTTPAVKIPPTHVDTAVTRAERASYLTDVTNADTLLGEVRASFAKKSPATRSSSTPPTTAARGLLQMESL